MSSCTQTLNRTQTAEHILPQLNTSQADHPSITGCSDPSDWWLSPAEAIIEVIFRLTACSAAVGLGDGAVDYCITGTASLFA